jgi:hypothetical protein
MGAFEHFPPIGGYRFVLTSAQFSHRPDMGLNEKTVRYRLINRFPPRAGDQGVHQLYAHMLAEHREQRIWPDDESGVAASNQPDSVRSPRNRPRHVSIFSSRPQPIDIADQLFA